jgi:hypothetical protein
MDFSNGLFVAAFSGGPFLVGLANDEIAKAVS